MGNMHQLSRLGNPHTYQVVNREHVNNIYICTLEEFTLLSVTEDDLEAGQNCKVDHQTTTLTCIL